MSYRIENHPVIEFSKPSRTINFKFNGKEVTGKEAEPIIVALRAQGVLKLKEGAKKHTPFGPFCMQGRCCSCAMTVNNKPNTMTCVTMLEEGMEVRYQGDELDVEVFKRLPTKRIDISPSALSSEHPKCELAIIGAGPAGMEAAIMAKEAGVKSIVLFDDKNYLGGQLTLQTHTFFGNEELGASVRGYELANLMKKKIEGQKIDTRLNSTVVGLYPQNMLGFRDEDRLNFIMAKKIICATGASEKFLAFEGNCLPGVMGAGGAQTFMNVHGVNPGKKALIIGGGNIGVILAYQMIQAGMEVAAVVEAGPKMGAYDVHVTKLQALGVPTLTRHTVKKAHGKDQVTGATIVKLDENWKEIAGSEQKVEVDIICLAVGLSPLNELLWQVGCDFVFVPELGEVPTFDKYRQTSNPDIFVAGDCAVIGEASIARLEGRIAGLKAALDLGYPHPDFNQKIDEAFTLLNNIQTGTFGRKLGEGKAKVTKGIYKDFVPKELMKPLTADDFKGREKKVIISCPQDIPCNPCEAACKFDAIKIGENMTERPSVDFEKCSGCGLCIPKCPGRAIKVLQYNYSEEESALTIPFEFGETFKKDDAISVRNKAGQIICSGKILRVMSAKDKKDCGTITFLLEKKFAFEAATINILKPVSDALVIADEENSNNSYICRCEEVTQKELVDLIKAGHDSINDLKRIKRVGMGQCRGLSCTGLVENLLKKELSKKPDKLLNIKINRRTMFRPPIKRITLGEAAKLKFSQEEIQLFEGIEHTRTIPQEIINTYLENNHQTKKNLSAKTVIIGGGIGGVMTAWWLAELGHTDVIVLEKSFLTSGKTGACLGGIRTGFNTDNKVARAKKGLEIFKDAKNIIGEDVGWHQGGYVYLSFDEKQDQLFKDSFKTWGDAKVEYGYHNDRSVFEKFVPGIDSEKIESIVHFPQAGGANPFKATYEFAKAAQKKGVRFLVNHEVVSIKVENNKVLGLTALDKESSEYVEIQAENIVNAAGTSCVRVSKMAGIDLSDQIWIERHGAFITEKMPLWLDPLVVSYHPTLSGYWQQKRMEPGINEGEIVACYSPSRIIKGFNTHSYIYFLSRMAKAILLCQPGMADVGIIRNFAEHYVGRKSGIPLIGETPVKGFWLNIAKKGHGFMCAPGDAYALAHTIVSGKTHEWITECTIKEDGNLKETMK